VTFYRPIRVNIVERHIVINKMFYCSTLFCFNLCYTCIYVASLIQPLNLRPRFGQLALGGLPTVDQSSLLFKQSRNLPITLLHPLLKRDDCGGGFTQQWSVHYLAFVLWVR